MWDRRQFIKTAMMATAATLTGGVAQVLRGATAQSYSVQRGDTLSGISQKFNITINELKSRNALTTDRIDIGQTLIISGPPPSTTYTVRSGDTLGVIARNHQTSVAAIRSVNQLSGDRIFPGQKLEVPADNGTAGISHRHIADVVRVTRSFSRLRSWKYIIGHHSAVNQGNAKIYDRFHRSHMRMPNGLAYHFVIGNGSDSRDGQIEIGDRWLKQLQGGHVRSTRINNIAIGICLVGNFEERRPTSNQLAAFTELVQYLKFDVLQGRCKFAVHREIDGSQTLCPGRNFPTAQMHKRFS